MPTPRASGPAARRPAFTLLEVIVALAIGGAAHVIAVHPPRALPHPLCRMRPHPPRRANRRLRVRLH